MVDKVCDHSPDTIREELLRVLASPDFDSTERIRKFLTYVVEETLCGHPERIKAYTIATSVFGRDENFDPQVDSIVRIVAGRMRRSLERYYLTEGRGDPLRIRIPKGSYVPVFEDPASLRADPREAPSHRSENGGTSILVEAFTQEDGHSTYPDFALGLTRSLIVGLARFASFRVFGPEASRGQTGDARPAKGNSEPTRFDYILRGGTAIDSEHCRAYALLIDARSELAIWGDSFECPPHPSKIYALRSDVANDVVRILAQPYGVIFSYRARDVEGAPPHRLSSYDRLLLFYQYWRTFDQELREKARECLEWTIQSEPNAADAFAFLSLVCSDSSNPAKGRCASFLDLRERALDLAERAIELAPSSSWGHCARSLAYWRVGDLRSSLDALETARMLNPNDSTIIAELGQRHAMMANWERAVPLIVRSFATSPAQPGRYRVGLFLYHYAHGRYRDAFMEARKIGDSDLLSTRAAIAMAAAQLGLREETSEAIRQIHNLDPGFGDHIKSDLEGQHLHPDLIRMIVDGLKMAALPGRDTNSSQLGLGR
ncbi:tetratricopeptide repeat protein [Pseudaminobacter soli (ex Li et al. 2025)]|uniref:Uncharacterized protein n=1 Tax=Pseudaminobacter soli (ex Li et al. 2025) TaxID=1295366 RepID=A0A2P7S2E5_9HYPH|nr:hypothetical protein [Mesorhizobium soli]PSJ56638.1 hypothetical protein C7I85_24065 [Mesorhizobium soli]